MPSASLGCLLDSKKKKKQTIENKAYTQSPFTAGRKSFHVKANIFLWQSLLSATIYFTGSLTNSVAIRLGSNILTYQIDSCTVNVP